MSTFERMLAVLSDRVGEKARQLTASPRPVESRRIRRSRSKTGSKSGGQRQLRAADAERLESRQLLAVTAFLEPNNAGGFLTIVGEGGVDGAPGDNIFVQKIATAPHSLLVADNSSFVNDPSAGLSSVQIPAIDSLGKIIITSGSTRADAGGLATGYPMSAESTTTFRLSNQRESGVLLGVRPPTEGIVSITQPDGRPTSWRFTNDDGRGFGDGLQPRLVTGVGVDATPNVGDYYPTSVTMQDTANPTLVIRWNVPQLSQVPILDNLVWNRDNFGPGYTTINEANLQPSAATQFDVALANAAGLGLGPIISSTFSGTLLMDGVPFSVSMSDSVSNTLLFNGDSTGTLRRGDLPNLADITFTGILITGASGGFRGLRLFASSEIGRVELGSARYAVESGTGSPVSATVFAGHDITNALDINLLTPGSVVSIDSPVRVAPTRASGVSLRATTIDLNARVTTTGRMDIGPAFGSDARAFETAAAVAEVVNGRVERLLLPPGLSGAGYDPDSPPVVTIAAPRSLQAVATVASLSNGVVSAISLREGAGGTGYTTPPTVTVSPPNGPGREARATATLLGTSVSGVQVTDGGSGYTRAPTVTFFSAAGTGAQADATIVGSIGIIRIVNGGFGYDPARPPAVRFVPAVGSGGTGATGTANVDATGRVISITVTSPGVGYSLDKTTIEIDPPPENTSPDIATARAIVDPATTRIVGFEMINKGSGYGEVPAISVASPVVAFSALRPVATVTGDAVSAVSFQSGTGLVVRVNAVNAAQGSIQSVTVPLGSGGSGYAVDDLVNLDSAAGPGRSAQFRVLSVSATGGVQRLEIVSGGSGYTAAEALTHSGTAGRGYGYAVAPRVFIDRPAQVDGRQATATARLDSEGRIASIDITDPGSGYNPLFAPRVSVDRLTPLAVAETVRFNAGIGASVYEIHTADDLHNDVLRSTVLVSATASLAADEFGSKAAQAIYVRSVTGDVIVAGNVFANDQSYLLQSVAGDQTLLPFRMTTVNPDSGVQTGTFQGTTLGITLANDLPTPQDGATAFNDVSIQTKVDSLRVRAARRKDTPVENPFPYILSVTEADSISIDAVVASTFPILLASQGNMTFTSALSTAGGVEVSVASGTFTMTAPISTTKGRLSVTASDIDLRNSLSVTAADQNEAVDDIVLNANNGDIRLNGGGIKAINRIVMNQKNKKAGSDRSPTRVQTGVVPISDFQTSTKTVTFEEDFVFDGVKVDVGITHTDLSDLSVTLIAPDGSRFRLVDRNARGANFTSTVFTSDATSTPAALPISGGAAPYTGRFLPLDSLAPLYGRRSRGIWTLEVRDRAFGDNGTLNSFSLQLNDPNGTGNGQIGGSSLVTGQILQIDAEGSVGNPGVLPGDSGFFLRTDVEVVNARVNGSFSLNDIGAVRINALQPGGPVSLRAEGVDPEIDASGNAVVPALLASMTDVTSLEVSAPRGSIDINVNTAGTLTVGNPATLSLDASIRNTVNSDGSIRVPPMRAAGGVRIRTTGGAAGGDMVVLDAPLAGASNLAARFATATQLSGTRYDKGSPGIFAASISSTVPQALSSVLPSGIRVGDRVLLTNGTADAGARASGLYHVTSLGGLTTPWKLVRAPEADTAGEFLPRSIVAVTDGSFAGQSFRIDYDRSQTFAASPVTVTSIATVTNIGSDDLNDALTFVVSTPDGTNTSAGSLGKLIGLRQANDTRDSANPFQETDFRFSTGITGPIKLQQELPAIVKAFAIDGNRRYPRSLPASSPIILDGSRVVSTRFNSTVVASTTVDAFTFLPSSGNATDATAAASLANVTVGGFSQGAAIHVNGASSILIDSVKLGVDAAGKRFVNKYNVLVAGSGASNASGTTIMNSDIVGASVAGITVQGTASGVTLVGNTIGSPAADNVVGVVMQSGINRIGVAGVSLSTIQLTTVNGSRFMLLPATMPAASLFLGQKVSGSGVAAGTTIAGISGQMITLSAPMTASGKNNVTFQVPAKNVVQNNLDGIVLTGGRTTVANTRVVNNAFDGIRIQGASHVIGTTPKVSVFSNEIWGNGRWGLSIRTPATVAAQSVTGNYFSSAAAGAASPNLAGDVGVNDVPAAAATGLVANASGIDAKGNQHALPAGKSGAPSRGNTPAKPVKFAWRPRRR